MNWIWDGLKTLVMVLKLVVVIEVVQELLIVNLKALEIYVCGELVE